MFPLSDTQPAKIFPIWVISIMVLNSYVFFLELTAANPDVFIETYALIGIKVNFSNIDTLLPFITSQFLHGGFLHIISNMWFLWVFGDNVEARLGVFFPFFYLVSGIVAGLIQLFFIGNSSIPMLGASGAIAGVLGAYFVFYPHHKIQTLVPVFGLPAIIPVPASLMLLYWFGLQLFSGSISIIENGGIMGGVAWFAHIGGFVTGWILGKMVR